MPEMRYERAGMMKNRLFPITCFIAFMVLMDLNPAFAAGLKIGIVDTQKIMSESTAAKRARDTFSRDLSSKRAVYKDRQDQVMALQNEFKREGKDLSPADRKEKGDRLAQEVKELRRLKGDLEEDLKKKDLELTQQLLREIGRIVQAFLGENGYTIILEKKSVVASDEAVDITDRIIKLYNSENK